MAEMFHINDVSLWRFTVSNDAPCDADATLLSVEEQERVAGFRDATPAHRFANGRIHIRRLLGGMLDHDPADLHFGYGRYGKPFLLDRPDLHLSWSHAGDCWLMAASRTAAIGVDIEIEQRSDDWEGPAAIAFHPDECQAIAKQAPEHRAQYFLRLWVRKEALVKAIGKGLHDSMRGISVVAANGADRMVVPLAGRTRWQLHDLPAPWVAALAVETGHHEGTP